MRFSTMPICWIFDNLDSLTYVLTVTRKGVIPSRSRVFQFTEVYWLVKWAFEMSFCVFWKVLTFNSRREEQMARLKGEARPLSEEHSSKRPIYIQILQASLPWTWLKRCYSHPLFEVWVELLMPEQWTFVWYECDRWLYRSVLFSFVKWRHYMVLWRHMTSTVNLKSWLLEALVLLKPVINFVN